MALPKLATSATITNSLIGANSFVLGQAAWHYRPAFLRNPPKRQKRELSASARCEESRLEERSGDAHQDLPPPSRPAHQQQQTPAKATPKSKTQTSNSTPPQTSASSTAKPPSSSTSTPTTSPTPTQESTTPDSTPPQSDLSNFSLPPGWEDNPDFRITAFTQLPHRAFGYNQHIKINEEFKESLRQILWQFKAPIRYAFAYGSGVFGQKSSNPHKTSSGGLDLSPHPNPPQAVKDWQTGGAKVIDFIFGVTHTQHWHSLNLTQNPHHYSGLRYLPYSSAVVSALQDRWGAGVYFNPYITVNGTMIKYGVVNLSTLRKDLSEWETLYLAGRLQKPVKILRDDPSIRLAQQVNLISALRTALLMLPETFTERDLYTRIAGLSYLGDPRMSFNAENPHKVANIVGAQLPGFRQLYVPLIENLPNVAFADPRTPGQGGWEKEDAIRSTGNLGSGTGAGGGWLGGEEGLGMRQDMSPERRGNMVRRLPSKFRRKVYFAYKGKFGIPASSFSDVLESAEDEVRGEAGGAGAFRKREGGSFEQRVAGEADLAEVMAKCVRQTVAGPATQQTLKAVLTAGVGRAWRYWGEKRGKGKVGGDSAGKAEGGSEGEGKE